MKAVHKKRLLKLADFLEKLPRKKFKFSTVVDGIEKPSLEPDCGSAACAIGWCPALFPRQVKYVPNEWNDLLDVVPRRGGDPDVTDFINSAMELFGVSRMDARELFNPYSQTFLPLLGPSATPKQVAKNIRRFVKLKEQQPIQ